MNDNDGGGGGGCFLKDLVSSCWWQVYLCYPMWPTQVVVFLMGTVVDILSGCEEVQ